MPNERAPFPSTMNENQRTIFMDRYSKRDMEGNPTESYADACARVATVVSSVVPSDLAHRIAPGLFPADVPLSELFVDLLYKMEFLPNSPTWTGASVTNDTDGQLAACFVLDLQDSLTDIMKTISNAVQIQKRGGGNGFPLHHLRPEGAIIRKSRGKTTGPVGFLRAMDKMYAAIEQGGVRRGANMAVMMIWHPDIRKFIHCKNLNTAEFSSKHKWFALLEQLANLDLYYEFKNEDGKMCEVSFNEIYRGFVQHMGETQITNFNISAGITDEFMRAVESDGMFKLSFPGYEKFDSEVRARDLMKEIAENAYKNGEPGMLFMDAANMCGVIADMLFEATNPCGEQYLFKNGTCTLGSVNFLLLFLANTKANSMDRILGHIDFEKMRRVVILSVIFLDCVVTANKYVPEVPAVKETAERYRNIGLGPMGVADLFFKLGIAYGSDESVYYTHVLMSHFQYYAMYASIKLAEVLGAFPAYKGSRLDREDPLFYSGKVRNPSFFPEGVELDMTFPIVYPVNCTAEKRREINIATITNMWSSYCKVYEEGDLSKLSAQYGVRHITETTVAPTGTISNVAGLYGGGCEPMFALKYDRMMKDKDQKFVFMSYLCENFLQALKDAHLTHEEIDIIKNQVVANEGSCQNIEFFSRVDHPSYHALKEIERVYVVAGDLSGNKHVVMQATFQYWISNSVSKTCNLPFSATVKDITDIYVFAWKMGCKGCTVYRNGSRNVEVLSTKKREPVEDKAKKTLALSMVADETPMTKIISKKAEDISYGKTIRRETKFGTLRVTVNYDEHGPFEILILIGKAGSDLLATVEGYGRAASILLQSTKEPLYRKTLLRQLIDQWKGIGGGDSYGFGEKRFISLPDSIARCIEKEVFSSEEFMEANISPVSEAEQLPPLVKFSGDFCPVCQMQSVIHQEGCAKCMLCSYSKCS